MLLIVSKIGKKKNQHQALSLTKEKPWTLNSQYLQNLESTKVNRVSKIGVYNS